MKKSIVLEWIILMFLLSGVTNEIKAQTNFIWGKQFGSGKDDIALNPVVDKFGNLYIAGYTSGTLAEKNYGKTDCFLTKIDTTGNIVWTRQFGTEGDDWINHLAIDGMGSIYLTGYTDGVLDQKNYGKEDIIVVKFDSSGKIEWQKQFGSDSSDNGNSILLDKDGYIYISGVTTGAFGSSSSGKIDCFLMKLDSKGNKLFTSQFGSSKDDFCTGITNDIESNIYVCGYTLGNLAEKNKGKLDAFVAKFNNKGEQIKIFQFGTEDFDMASFITIDNKKNIFIGGSTAGNLGCKPLGEGDNFLAKMDENGKLIWTQQFGTNKWDGINGIDLKENISDNIVVSGCQNWPSCQAFIRMYKKNGELLWVREFSGNGKKGSSTCGKGVCLDDNGYIYHVGITGANLFNTAKGEHDIYVLKLGIDKNFTTP